MTYTIDNVGIHYPDLPVTHRDEEYPESGFEALLQMQQEHFWYVGRHRFLLGLLSRHLEKSHRAAIDLGGGAGGWIRYLLDNPMVRFDQYALGDSSKVALVAARKGLPATVDIFQVDLMSMHWKEKWDVVFLLDVIEHCPDDEAVLNQVYESLKPGGIVVVATPALMCFWSYNDEYSKHQRRYNIADYKKLASKTGFTLVDARYFMFFLSPLYWLSRKTKRRQLSGQELKETVEKEHRLPHPAVNFVFSKIFSAETPVGQYIKFPWGTSVAGVFKKKIP